MSSPGQTDWLHLEEFPVDIILQISNFFTATPGLYASNEAEAIRKSENAERRRALHSLTLTCRKFNSILQPILYRSFIQTPDNTSSARLLMRTLVDQPNLSKHIQYIEASYTNIDPPYKPSQYSSNCEIRALPYDRVTHDKWQEFERHFSMIQWKSSLKGTKPFEWFHYEFTFGSAWVNQQPEAYIAFIMANTPNLNMVAVSNPHVLYTATLASRDYQSTSGLQKLWLKQKASVRNRESGAPLRVTSVIGQAIRVAFPVSENLTLVNAYSYLIPSMTELIPNAWFFGPGVHELKDLVLDACEISSDHLHGMLSKHTSLERFTLRWGVRFEECDYLFPQAIDLALLKSTLSASRYTLEYLVIDARNAGQKNFPNQIVRSIGSLRCFSALKYIEVCDVVLWGYNQENGCQLPLPGHLPESLEVLVIRSEWNTGLERFLLEISKQRKDTLPKLRLVDCSWALVSQSKSTETVTRQFEDLGIEIFW